MSKLKLRESSVTPKRDFQLSTINLHSGMFPGVRSFDIGQVITLEVKVKINSLRLADQWQITEYKGIKNSTEFADAQILSVKERKNG